MGYNQQDGLFNYAKDQYKRYNVRANVSTNITSWLTFNFRTALSRAKQTILRFMEELVVVIATRMIIFIRSAGPTQLYR
ncbi:hypothetical protein KUH03_17090 [Sphingobacterium sp. E70]|uniref:hypothetical protein n=1 Tax=Sphingobacterium sp. E70 TaxID=2853439 RepID=UPI00211BE7E0|nr:hypothetical protein [Sphingobacterium sp. E70]ULT28154.1 hypothetical protein KUH03_17090 [Sphingobacterium sp. E70]